MKPFVIAVLLAVAGSSAAATPTESYLATEKRAVAAMITPAADTECMNLHLQEIST